MGVAAGLEAVGVAGVVEVVRVAEGPEAVEVAGVVEVVGVAEGVEGVEAAEVGVGLQPPILPIRLL